MSSFSPNQHILCHFNNHSFANPLNSLMSLSLSVVLLGNPQLCVNSTPYFLLIKLITYRAQVCIQRGLATLQPFSWMGQVLTSSLRSLCVIFLLKLQTPPPLLLPSTSDLTCHFNEKEMKPLAGVPSLPASEPTLLPFSLPPLYGGISLLLWKANLSTLYTQAHPFLLFQILFSYKDIFSPGSLSSTCTYIKKEANNLWPYIPVPLLFHFLVLHSKTYRNHFCTHPLPAIPQPPPVL